MSRRSGTWWRSALAVAAHPSLWFTALVTLFQVARRGWWRRLPFIPLPDRGYLRFRMQTMYGDPDHRAESADLVSYLRWCRRMRNSLR